MQDNKENYGEKSSPTTHAKATEQETGLYELISFTPSISCIPTIELIKGLCWDTMEKLTWEDAEQSPCQVK